MISEKLEYLNESIKDGSFREWDNNTFRSFFETLFAQMQLAGLRYEDMAALTIAAQIELEKMR